MRFYDWQDWRLVGRIVIATKDVYWSDQAYVFARHIVILSLQCYLPRPWQILSYADYRIQCVGRLEEMKPFQFLLYVLHRLKVNETNVVLQTTVTKHPSSSLLSSTRPRVAKDHFRRNHFFGANNYNRQFKKFFELQKSSIS